MAKSREVEQQAPDITADREGEAAEALPRKIHLGGMEIAGIVLWSLVVFAAIGLAGAYFLI